MDFVRLLQTDVDVANRAKISEHYHPRVNWSREGKTQGQEEGTFRPPPHVRTKLATNVQINLQVKYPTHNLHETEVQNIFFDQ